MDLFRLLCVNYLQFYDCLPWGQAARKNRCSSMIQFFIITMTQAIRTLIQAEIKAAFSLFDLTGEGIIEYKDFGTLMRSMGYEMSEETASAIAQKLDKKQDGFLRYSDFRAYLINKLNSKDIQQDFKKTFDAIDTDHDKYISFQDLSNFLELIGQRKTEEQINEMISDADIDGDGMISFQEFSRLMLFR